MPAGRPVTWPSLARWAPGCPCPDALLCVLVRRGSFSIAYLNKRNSLRVQTAACPRAGRPAIIPMRPPRDETRRRPIKRC
jgi:hypothetical protein